MPAADEQQLILLAREGSQEAFRMLVDSHIRQAYDVAFGFVRDHDTAEDIVQEAFLRAHAALHGFRGEARFGTWIHRIVVNLSLNTVKRRQRKAAREVPLTAVSAFVAPEETGAHNDVRETLERALHELPTLQRAVVILRHMEGLSTRQVSDILGCSEGTVKTHLFRGLEKMRKSLRHLKPDLV